MGLTRKQWAMLAVLVIGSFVAILNQTLMTPAQPTIMREMNVDASTIQWLTTGFTLVNAVMIPITAYLTDRFTAKRLFVIAMSIFTVGTLVVAASVNFPMLLGGRFIQAAGAGILMPMIMTVMLLTFPTEHRGTAMGFYGVVLMLAPSVGPVISGIIVDHVSWHYMFYGIAVLVVLCIVAAFVFIDHQEKVVPDGLYLDKLSVVFSTLGFGGVLYGLSVIGSYGISAQSIIALVIGAVILVLFFRRQLKLDVPMLEVRVLKTRKFSVATAIGMVVQASIMANGVLIPIFVQNLCGQSATISGLVMLPGALVMGLMGPVAGRLFDKHGPRGLAITGLVILLVGTVLVAMVDTAIPMVALGAIMVVRLFGMSLINMPLNTWGINALDNKLINHGNAVGNTFRQVSGSFGCALVVSIYSLVVSAGSQSMDVAAAQLMGFNIAFWVQACFILAALVLTVVMVKEKITDSVNQDPEGTRKSAIEKIMHRDVYTIHENDTVSEGVDMLLEKGISALPVINDAEEVIGFFSDGDVMRALSNHGTTLVDPVSALLFAPNLSIDQQDKLKLVMASKIGAVAHPGVITVDIHDDLSVICKVMGENHLKKVPVMDGGKLVGVINRSDITRDALATYRGSAEA